MMKQMQHEDAARPGQESALWIYIYKWHKLPANSWATFWGSSSLSAKLGEAAAGEFILLPVSTGPVAAPCRTVKGWWHRVCYNFTHTHCLYYLVGKFEEKLNVKEIYDSKIETEIESKYIVGNFQTFGFELFLYYIL